ncbi:MULTISPECIES: sigma-54-dependent Fis family transcriptional regulator [unclassified Undibacterium]|uniref:sigma-54-dependent Fis family transcriptional regulator n=2 Tax=Undibacterium TaxID=401469 RepID=UPI002AC8BB45|nr:MULTISPECIES: sigma-54-dependent Fis family transcriptional regulator [unclassified Undibacterium]WPX45181.1 sigma-54-dependent Fis family transcriptional regulator [Undibacterium sp. CCC3.4]
MHDMANNTDALSVAVSQACVGAPAGLVVGADQGLIAQAHGRSAAYGVQRSARPDYELLGKSDLADLLEQNRQLSSHALPMMEVLYEQIATTRHMVVLTDMRARILHSLGQDAFLSSADRLGFHPGVAWSEQSQGTNAIGTAIAGLRPTSVHGDEHYLYANHRLSCSAAPIFDPYGKLIGVLDVTGEREFFHQHTLALVRMSAQMIENHLFNETFQQTVKLHFHSRPAFLGTLMEGVACFNPEGQFLSANRSGIAQIGLSLAALRTHSFSSLFGLPISAVSDRSVGPGMLQLTLPNGLKVAARWSNLHLAKSPFQLTLQNTRSDRADLIRQSAATRPVHNLAWLNTGDTHIALSIEKLRKVIGRGISILLTGETGTGKEWMARAIHQDSPRQTQAFVALNCASIPESLIESELFGYEEGAFTGARKKGQIGKILQADGGTLFLDEIGDMPLNLQARLLRVLQERMITPLGSDRAIAIDIALICATNRPLREMIAKASFRDDLYYRLNGLVVKLPPLRERSDLAVIIDRLLQSAELGLGYRLADEVFDLFLRHTWPGNFRQLSTLLKTAMLMTGGEREIRFEHLPDDFLEDAGIAAPGAAAPAAGTMDQIAVSVIQSSLASHAGNVSATARSLGISRNTIYRKRRE